MALDRSSTLDHGSPLIVLLVLCPAVLLMVIFYYLVRCLIRKDRQRRQRRDSANATMASSTPSVITAAAPQRELHRWIPYLPPPATPTPSSVPPTPSPRHTISEHSFHAEALSPTPSGPSTRSPSPYSLPILELDVVPTSHVALTPLPPAVITQDVTNDASSRPHYDEDPFADPGPSYVRSAESTAYASSRADIDTVTVPAPAESMRSSVDWMSITTSSTLPPSYRTHRPTYQTASDASYSGHGRRREMVGALIATDEHGSTSYQVWPDRRSRHYPRKSTDGGVRLEGGPVDPATGRGAEKRPRDRKKL